MDDFRAAVRDFYPRQCRFPPYMGRLTETKRESQSTNPFPLYGLTGVGLRPRRGLDARDTPILAFPDKGERDLLTAIRT